MGDRSAADGAGAAAEPSPGSGSGEVGSVAGFAEAVRAEVRAVILGKADAIDLLVVAFLCQGHVLIEDVPGTGKTMLARAFAASLGRDFQRLQCTPDLLPSEVTGVNVFDQRRDAFEFREGPVFTDVLLVDEINRATPRSQAALLEAMAERQASVDGTTRTLGEPFLVLATQNPVEHAGTFPLPEAQLDRFLLRIELGYPAHGDERDVLNATRDRHPVEQVRAAAAGADLPSLWQEVRDVHIDGSVLDWLLEIVRSTREHGDVHLGASVRGSMALRRAAQARAAIAGRDFVMPDDVAELAVAVLGHRLLLAPESQVRGVTAAEVVSEVLSGLDVPVEETHA
jgi:MoxR-like ATPase